MEIIYSGAGGAAVEWTTEYANKQMQYYIFSKYIDSRKKDLNDINRYIEAIPKLNEQFDADKFRQITTKAFDDIKSKKIGDFLVLRDESNKFYFKDLVQNYTIEELSRDKTLDKITRETSRVDFSDEIEDGWGNFEAYFNTLWETKKTEKDKKTAKQKLVPQSKATVKETKTKTGRKTKRVIILDEQGLKPELPNKGAPKNKLEKLSDLGFDWIYGQTMSENINLKDTSIGHKDVMRFGKEGRPAQIIDADLMQSFDKFYNRTKREKGGAPKKTFDLPFIFTRTLYFIEEIKEDLDNWLKTWESSKGMKLSDKEKERKKKIDGYYKLTKPIREEMKKEMEVYDEVDKEFDAIENKIKKGILLSEEELTRIDKIDSSLRMKVFSEEYEADKENLKDEKVIKHLLETFSYATSAYDDIIEDKWKGWLEQYQTLGKELFKEFEAKQGIKREKTTLSSADEKKAWSNPKSFIKTNKGVIRALNDLKTLYTIKLVVTETITKDKEGKEKPPKYTVNTFMLTAKQELVPPIVPKGQGGGSEASPFKQRQSIPHIRGEDSPLSGFDKKPYEVKNDINLFAKRINKKLKQLNMVI
tara:strand:+ start:4292 stop:6052 length:1761 start_codon:yes stop_codon:yes gene_type:complete